MGHLLIAVLMMCSCLGCSSLRRAESAKIETYSVEETELYVWILREMIDSLKSSRIVVDCPESIFEKLPARENGKSVVRGAKRLFRDSYFLGIKWVFITGSRSEEGGMPALYKAIVGEVDNFDALVDVYHDMGTGPVRTLYCLKRDASGAWTIVDKKVYLVT